MARWLSSGDSLKTSRAPLLGACPPRLWQNRHSLCTIGSTSEIQYSLAEGPEPPVPPPEPSPGPSPPEFPSLVPIPWPAKACCTAFNISANDCSGSATAMCGAREIQSKPKVIRKSVSALSTDSAADCVLSALIGFISLPPFARRRQRVARSLYLQERNPNHAHTDLTRGIPEPPGERGLE